MADKKTIGVTAKGKSTLETMMLEGHFKDEVNAAQFAIAVALVNRRLPGSLADAGTKWSTAGFEGLRDALGALGVVADEPYRALESLLDQGLGLVQDDIDKLGHFRLSRFMVSESR